MEHIIHSIEPVFDAESRVLILGTMPSPKSREVQFYYGHPQNRFWRVLAAVLGEEVPRSVPEKKAMLLRHRIALWDVLAECEITGASDSSIRNPVANDLSVILDHAPVQESLPPERPPGSCIPGCRSPIPESRRYGCLPPARLTAL